MEKAQLVRCNDTLEYNHATCLSISGVFTVKQIDSGTVLPGFYTYYLTTNKEGVLSGVYSAQKFNKKDSVAGTFISNAPIPDIDKSLFSHGRKDCDLELHPEKVFDFEAFFGTKPSLDCQIEDAYRRRDAQIKEAKERKKYKTMEHAKEGRGGR